MNTMNQISRPATGELEKSIRLRCREDVQMLVNMANRFSFSIALRQGIYRVDAKSILGAMCLDMHKPVEVDICADQADRLMRVLDIFAA